MKYKTYTTKPKPNNHRRKILGLNGLNHDASACLLHGKEIKFAGHNERYTDIKFDEDITQPMISDIKRYEEKVYTDADNPIDTDVWFIDGETSKGK